MSIIVNTNMTALKTQKNLTNSTNALNTSLERMSTGLKINKAGDDAAGLYVATGLNTQIRGSKVAQSNVSIGNNVLQTVESDLDNILTNLNRIRDLATQAANSVYSADARKAMADEVTARMAEIDRLSSASNFNGLALLTGDGTSGLSKDGMRLQVGANADATGNSVTIPADIFKKTDSTTLGNTNTDAKLTGKSIKTAAADVFATNAAVSLAAHYISVLDSAINTISSNKSTIGAVMNRLDAAATSLTTTIENNTAAKSTIMDADIASESADYTKAQILQQTSATLLVQANKLPQIAINLVQG